MLLPTQERFHELGRLTHSFQLLITLILAQGHGGCLSVCHGGFQFCFLLAKYLFMFFKLLLARKLSMELRKATGCGLPNDIKREHLKGSFLRVLCLPGYGTLPLVTSSVSKIPKDHTSDLIVNLPYRAASGAVHLMGNFAPAE